MSKGQIDLTSKFSITYTGLIYTGKQDPSKRFAALRDLISDGTMDPKDIEVRFHGPERDRLPSEIRKYGLSAIVRYFGIVPREIFFRKTKRIATTAFIKLGRSAGKRMVSSKDT